MDKLNILVSVNSKFLKPLEVLLYSLYKTQSHSCNIFLLNISLLESELEEINDICKRFNFNFTSYNLPNDILECLNTKNEELLKLGLSIETYSRLFIPSIFPDIDRILWLDADCLVKKDLHDFYFQDLKDKVIAACDHCNWILPEIPQFSYYDYPNRKKYGEHFNAGVILFDLNKCRRIKGFQIDNMIKIIKELKCDFFDQGILNFLLPPNRVSWNNTLLYNTCINQNWGGGFNNHPIRYKIFDESYILHYCSSDKPWDLKNNMDWKTRKYWLSLYSEFQEFKNGTN